MGFTDVAFTLAQAQISGNPALAYELAPYSGRATAGLAATLSTVDASSVDRRRADILARLALRQELISVSAVSTLGLNADARGDVTTARRMFTFAEKLSRRDLQAQLWAITTAVSQGDVAGALRHYDIALRTNPFSSAVLFPVLASAIANPGIRDALTRTLAAKPVWTDDFIAFAADKAPDPRATAMLFVGLHGRGLFVGDAAQARVIGALVKAGHIADAWSYYAAFHPGADRRRSRDPRFAVTSETPSPFDWVPINDGTVSTSSQGDGFEFTVPATAGGLLLRQAELLPAGTYHLVGRSDGIDQPAGSRPYWRLACGDGRELGRVELPNSAQGSGGFAGTLIVPSGCPTQTLELFARASDGAAGLSGRITRVQLVPAS